MGGASLGGIVDRRRQHIANHVAKFRDGDTTVPRRPPFDKITMRFHWATVLIVLAMFVSAWLHSRSHDDLVKPVLLQIHRSLGVTIWMVTALRVAWRLTNTKMPPLPSSMTRLLRAVVKGGEYSLYALLLGQPVSGLRESYCRVPQRPERGWLRGGPQRSNRVPLGERSGRSATHCCRATQRMRASNCAARQSRQALALRYRRRPIKDIVESTSMTKIGNERDESPRLTERAGDKARATLKREISPQPVERDNGPIAEADQKVDVGHGPDQPGKEAA
jgi:hypothetical protein